jgi:hypothetical protein
MCSVLMLAGVDTTATALSCLAYHLSVHEDVQDKLMMEIDDFIKEDVRVIVVASWTEWFPCFRAISTTTILTICGIWNGASRRACACHRLPAGTNIFVP